MNKKHNNLSTSIESKKDDAINTILEAWHKGLLLDEDILLFKHIVDQSTELKIKPAPEKVQYLLEGFSHTIKDILLHKYIVDQSTELVIKPTKKET